MNTVMETEGTRKKQERDQGRKRAGRRGPRRRSRLLAGVVIGSLVGCLFVAGVLVLRPDRPNRPQRPAPRPAVPAMTAVANGVPAALDDLEALIGDREARLRARPADARSWAVLGAAYVQQGRRTADATNYPKAEQALRMSLKVRPRGNVDALNGMAALANARRDFRTARKWAQDALKADPKRWTTYPQLIDAYTGLGDYKASRRTLERLQELHSGPAVMARAAGVYWDRGWREDAAATLSDAAAAAASPAERAAWLERAGQLAWERGDLKVALRYFEEAVRLDPDQRAAQAGQGRVLAALGRTAQALSAYRVALDKQPSPGYALELGELYESLGLQEAAGVQFERLRSQVHSAAEGGVDEELMLGRFEADHGDPEAAVERLRAEWRRQPGLAVADALGWALHRAGEHEEALWFAERATNREHGGEVRSALYSYHRGMIEKELGLDGPARRHLREALRINPYFSPLHVPVAEAALGELGEPDDA
ncbi:tetratricopeptide repeat protein [Streptomyces sp. NPDC127197]|uniref:tetratricopeptide repeat protein n=1 Tax=Streptomyces sp. NPDC127197 TaxID=3345388 RepID=UPI003631E47B